MLQVLFHIKRLLQVNEKLLQESITYYAFQSEIKWFLKHLYLPSQQVKSGVHQSSLTLCDMSSIATSLSLPFSGTSISPVLNLASLHAEGNGNRVFFLANNNSVIKSETPEPPTDKPARASFPAAEVAKTQDCPSPQPIPEGKDGSSPRCTN